MNEYGIRFEGLAYEEVNEEDQSEFLDSQILGFDCFGPGITLSLPVWTNLDNVIYNGQCLLVIDDNLEYCQLVSNPRWRDLMAFQSTYCKIDLDHTFLEGYECYESTFDGWIVTIIKLKLGS